MRYSSNIFIGMAYMFFGALCLLLRSDVIFIAAVCLGVVLCVIGITELLQGNLYFGIVGLAIGTVVLILGQFMIWVMLYIIAIAIIAFGIYKLNLYFRTRAVNDPFWCAETIRAILLIVCGVLMFLNLKATVTAIFVIIGILLIAAGIMAIIDDGRSGRNGRY